MPPNNEKSASNRYLITTSQNNNFEQNDLTSNVTKIASDYRNNEVDLFDHSDSHEHPELQFSFKQMYIDTLNLDWSKVLWDMVFSMVVFHVISFYGVFLALTFQPRWQTWILTPILSYAGGLGITMGTHRLWTHKAFKAVLPVRITLMILNSLAFQESIFLWCQNHRVHHKWSDTDRDFTNSRRGFFFAHMGWKMYETHPEVIKGRKLIDCSDLLEDLVVRVQHEYYYYIALPVCFILPTMVPVYFWNEDPIVAFACCACLRLAITFHSTWCINSVAHLYGYKPYDVTLHAFENKFLGPFALGEGWHNFHHAFPRDYRCSEMDGWGVNFTTKVIEFCASHGLIYDLVTVTEDHRDNRIHRTGNKKLHDDVLAKQHLRS